MSAQPSHVRVLAQTDPLANRLRNFGDDLKHAKALVADLTTILQRLDDDSADLQAAGVTMSYTLGPIGDAAASVRRDLENRQGKNTFQLPTAPT